MSVQVRSPANTTDVGGGDIGWEGDPATVETEDGVAVGAVNMDETPKTSSYLKMQDFGFAVSDPIHSVVLSIKKNRLADGGTVEDSDVKALDATGAAVGSNLAASGDWPTTLQFTHYTIDHAGLGLNAAAINDVDFGAQIRVLCAAATMEENTTGRIDFAKITVTYGTPPPPLPGTGGLNTGGAFFLGMIAQQMGCWLLGAALGLAGLTVASGNPRLPALLAVIGEVTVPAVGADEERRIAALAGDHAPRPVVRVAAGRHEVLHHVAGAAAHARAFQQAAAEHQGDHHHPKRQSSTPHLTSTRRGQFNHRDTS
jgi:hypothetical protein